MLVVRHGIAEDPADFARSGLADAERPLTKTGRRKMRRVARGLVMLVPHISVLATSPLVRAVQTAEVLEERLAKWDDRVEATRLGALAPGKGPNLLLGWLAQQPREGVLAIVGHEPGLGEFVSWALTGLRDSFVELKKGGAVLIEFSEDVRAGRAKLIWSLKPSHLRAIADAKG